MKINTAELESIKDKKINDNDWSCLVILLIESEPQSIHGIDLFEKSARSSDRKNIQNLIPKDIEMPQLKEKVGKKEKGSAHPGITKSSRKSEFLNPSNTAMYPPGMLQALLLKKYILEYKEKDLAKRIETIRYLLNDEINLPDSDSSIPEPDYGAFCYFVLTKFYNPFLINKLIDIQVPLVAVFEFRVIEHLHLSLTDETKHRVESINDFWNEFMKQLNNPDNKNYYSEFLFLPIEIHFEQWNGKKKGDVILEHVLRKLLSMNKLVRNYIHYINNVKIIDAPSIFTEGNMDTYNMLVDSIPLECVTVELIVHCIVEQVVAHFEVSHRELYIETNEYNFEEKETKFPILFIDYRDKIRRMSFNLKTNTQLNLSTISSHMHSLMPYATIFNYYPSQTEVEKAINANQIKKLLSCTNKVIPEDKFLAILHIISFNKVMSSATHSQILKTNESRYNKQFPNFLSILEHKENSSIMTDDKSSTKSNPNIQAKRHIHLKSLARFLDCNEFESLISYDFRKDLNYFCNVEDLSKQTLLQILNKAHSTFLHSDYYYCPLTDNLLLWFHNFYDEYGLYSYIKEGLLNISIGFGDFYTYPDDETDEWLSNQTKQMISVDDALRKSYISRNFPDINPISFVLNPSIKVKIPFPKKEYMNMKSGKVPFLKVYNSFGSNRIKVSEQSDLFISVDGPSLIFKKTKWLRKEGSITIILNSHHNLLTVHQPLLNLNKLPIYDTNQEVVFNIQSKKGIIVSTMFQINVDDSFIPLEPGRQEEPQYETLITLPNGLVIEIFRGKYNFIRQTFLDKNHLEDNHLRQEDYRIFLNNGTIIVFMNDGSILILYSNSTEARIKIVGKKPSKYRNDDLKDARESGKDDSILDENEEMAFEIIRHEIIGWNGRFLRFNKDELLLSLPLYGLKAAFCTARGLFTARSDGTKCYVDQDGILTTSFPDKTITTVIPTLERVETCSFVSNDSSPIVKEEVAEPFVIIDNEYIMDHPYYMKIKFSSDKWTVGLPFEGQFTASTKGFELAFDKYTNIKFRDGLVSVTSRNKLNMYKNTLTSIFLKGEVPFEYTICSVKSSDGKVFNVSNTGGSSLTTVKQTAPRAREPSVPALQDQTQLKPQVKARGTNATEHFGNQILVYSKIDLDLEKDSNTAINSTKKFGKTKIDHRFFVLNRDLSGYELINEFDIKNFLKKYETNFREFKPFLSCTTIKNGITVCQFPLSNTWNDLFWTPCSNSRLCNTGLKKNELITISKNQTWLCNLKILNGSQKQNFNSDNQPIINDICLKYPSLLIRRIKNIISDIDVFEMFKLALRKYKELNCEILYKYEKQLIPVKKLQSDIDKAEIVFRNAMEELLQSTKTEETSVNILKKGDSVSTTASSVSSIKIEESDETDSKKNATVDSQSE